MSNVFNPNKHTIYQPLNPKKYIGKELPISRSSYETAFCKWCDGNTGVIQWVSEPFAVPYYDIVKKKNRRYYPDFLIKVINRSKEISTYVIEIKPLSQVVAPVKKSNKKTYMNEMATYATNMSKWNAADIICKKKGWQFKIITEKEIFK